MSIKRVAAKKEQEPHASKDESYSDEEIARRRDDVIRRMANTPPKPHSAMKLGKCKAKTSTKANPPEKRGRPKKKFVSPKSA
jgi:hypothetical protein